MNVIKLNEKELTLNKRFSFFYCPTTFVIIKGNKNYIENIKRKLNYAKKIIVTIREFHFVH
jgi:hypothetical protein